jgi:predicted metal-dependent hydrolase
VTVDGAADSSFPAECRQEFLEGLRLFDAGRYHEAHDALEEVWFDEVGSRKQAVQALIQIAVALHHRELGNRVGAAKLFERAAGKLAPLEDSVLSLDVRDLERRARRLAEDVRGRDDSPRPLSASGLVPRFEELRRRLERRREALRAEGRGDA